MRDVIQNNAIIKSKEARFLSDERIKRMLNSESFDEAVKVLYESGYGDGKSYQNNQYYKLTDAELLYTLNTFSLLCADKNMLEIVLTRYLYHNAKAIYKSKYVEFDLDESLFKIDGLEDIAEAVLSGEYKDLKKEMQSALKELDVKYSLNPPNPFEIDNTLDKAMYQNIASLIKFNTNKTVKEYYNAEIELLNIVAAFRARINGISEITLRNILINTENGSDYLKILTLDYDKIPNLFINKDYYKIIVNAVEDLKANKGFAGFEKDVDNFLLKIARRNKDDYFKSDPLFSYLMTKLNEIKSVKVILMAKLNNVSGEQIRLRMRDIYA